jgi:hypothetical protein
MPAGENVSAARSRFRQTQMAMFVNPSGAVSGSGIGQIADNDQNGCWSVDLLAPRGIVDAGDAVSVSLAI